MGIQVGGRIFSGDHTITLPNKSGTMAMLDDIPGGGAGILKVSTVALTDAQIKALIANPVQILPAAPAGKVYYFPILPAGRLDTTAGAYTYPVVGDPAVQYAFGGVALSSATYPVAPGAFEAAAIAYGTPQLDYYTEEAVTVANLGDAEWEGGNAANTLTINLFYIEIDK